MRYIALYEAYFLSKGQKMAKFSVLAEYNQIWEIIVEADTKEQAYEIAEEADTDQWKVWDDTGLSDAWNINIDSIEELEKE